MSTKDWLVQYRRRGASVENWALIEEVPRSVNAQGVLDALADWSMWPSWQARMAPGGRLTVTAREDAVKAYVYGGADGFEIPWEKLSPVERRLSIPLKGELHVKASRAARAANMSLAEWVRDVIAAAVE